MEPGARVTGDGARFVRDIVGGALALAALTLLLPFEPVFDAWSWMIWGREVTGLDLDTSAGASWKPLPVLFTAPFSLFGDLAPALWLLVARAGWFAALALAARLAWRLARDAGAGERETIAAGAIAAIALILLWDPFTPWIRQFAGGLSEPLLVALLLGAIEAHLVRARGIGLALLTAAALLRPEAWPFLAGYGLWLWRSGAPRAPIALAFALVPLLWLGPDLLGSGNAISGAERAAGADDEGALTNGLEALWRAANLAPAALLAALAALLLASRPGAVRLGPIVPLTAMALGWIGIVFAMSLFGFAGLPRFSAPAGALLCIVGAAALVLLWSRRGWLRAAAAVAALALAVQGGFRAAELGGAVGDAAAIHRDVDGMRAAVAALGGETFARCGAVSTTDLDSQPALAWELDRSVSEVSLRRASVPEQGIALIGPAAPSEARLAARRTGPPVLDDGEWSAYLIGCAPAIDSPAGSSGSAAAAADGARK